MKKIIGIIISFTICMSCYAQKPRNGIYKESDGYICVSDTIIIMDIHTHRSYFYGSYSIHDDEVVLGYNNLIGKNATINVEKCSQDSIEIKLICKYEIIVEEADKYPRQSMRCIFYSENTKRVDSRNDGCIYIGYDANNNEFNIDEFYIQDYVQFLFADKFKIPLEYGTRYVISQKYTASALFLNGDTSWVSFKVKRHGKRIEMYHKRTKTKEIFHYVGECDSCLEEFSKQFPGLIE
ncbi:MAG: hypothetical protein MJZ90_11620 [Bacteroidales bacterium]|nr:hypothetical protein [Bacteroidales bacterium]